MKTTNVILKVSVPFSRVKKKQTLTDCNKIISYSAMYFGVYRIALGVPAKKLKRIYLLK